MKKFLIFLGILFSSCFLINSEVHAYYYTEDDVTYDYEFFKNLILEKQNINLDDYEYVIIQTDDFGSSTGIVFTILFWNNSDYKVSSLNEKGKKITLKNFDDAYFVAYYPHSWQGFNFFNLKDKSSSSSWQEDGKNQGFSVYHDTWINENNSLTRYKSSTKGLNYIEFEGVKYYFDDYLSSGSESQTVFDDKIYGTKYSKVEFIFDIKGNVEQNLNFNYDFHLVQSNGKLDEFNTFSSPYFIENSSFCSDNSCSIPKNKYFRILKKAIDDSSEIDKDYVFSEFDRADINSSRYNSYVVDDYNLIFNNDVYTKTTSSFKLVIDLTFDSSLIVDSYFKSSIPFKVNYVERNSELSDENYYSEIDLTGKYGVLFIPKVDTSVAGINYRTLFQSTGHLDIQHRSSYDVKNYDILAAYSMNYCNDYLSLQKEIPYSCDSMSGSFEFYITNDMLNQSLFFINTTYNNSLTSSVTISYDTRYYVYYVFSTPDTELTITNPNTGEDYTLTLKDFFNYVEEKEKLNISLNTFLKPIKFILTSITDFYNNYCPAVVQKFLYISFMFVVVLIVIKIIW